MLRYTEGNRRRAAQLLGISRSTLLHKVRKYGLDQS
jgi:DNA-binding protein Fis